MLVVITQNFNHHYSLAFEVDGREIKPYMKDRIIQLAIKHLNKLNSQKNGSIKYAKGEYLVFIPRKFGLLYEVDRLAFKYKGNDDVCSKISSSSKPLYKYG